MISQLGRYEIISELGQGAMGVVYKAKDPLIDRIVAIKTISLGLGMAPEEKNEYEARFYQEAKAAGRLSHPNIVTVFDVGKSEDVAYIAMEFLEGRELRDILNENPHLPVNQVLDIAIQVAQGLSYAHEHSIVHRDVKPSNIMVIRDGHVKITDFGIARMESASVRTQTGMILGSPKYMSPEQVLGKVAEPRSDIFSLGVLLYEMLTGRSPFDGENVNAIMYQVLNATPPQPGTLNSAVPSMLNFIVAKALAKEQEERYQDAGELVNDLRTCRDEVLRSGAPIGVVKPGAATSALPDAIHVAGVDVGSEESALNSSMTLSPSFDSADATMRLAALTNEPQEVEEISRTIRMMRPTNVALHAAKPKSASAGAQHPVSARPHPSGVRPPSQGSIGNLLLIVIILLVLSGLAAVFVF